MTLPTPIERLTRWWFEGPRPVPFDCQNCGTHVPTGERIDGRYRACSDECAAVLWDSHQM